MKFSKSKLRLYLAAGYFVAAYILIMIVWKLPGYWLAAAYAGFALALAVFSRDDIAGYIGRVRFAQGRTDEAIKIFDAAILRNTKNPAVYLHRAIILVKDGDGKAALPYLHRALELKPEVITEKNALLTLGSCYWILGDIDRAIDVLEGMRVKFSYVNSHVLVTLGYLYILKEDYDRAEQLTRCAIDDNPAYGSAWDNLGQIQFRRSEAAEAKESFLKAVELKSDLVDSLYYLGLIAETDNDAVAAKEYFSKASVCSVTALNTVTKEQIQQKLDSYVRT